MRFYILAGLVIFAWGCSERNPSNPPSPKTVVDAAPDSKEARFVFVAPDGFEWNDKHGIWYNKRTRMSITVAHAPGESFQAVVDDFVADRMLATNMELLSKDTRDVDGRATLLVHGNRLNAKYPQQFSTVAYGTRTGCAQLTAIYPRDTAGHLKTQIEDSLLTSRYEVPD
ncbi:hypothetical protein ETAA8_40360 [Anatilimnocola aggregata]|uniref:Uncharacterized protein n=1 Tax=Anatilimnocola aggregata TaxID=2528021 RepID=A0A517YFC8_9BACT|nr:hypothetical protein ETAA8_40360 [Anatilimnocola aggregata]